MRIAYADPPYPGMAHFYEDHPDFAGEVDHAELVERLRTFDGWCLHTASVCLSEIAPLAPEARVMAWVKSFASFKKHVTVAYAWEPVLVVPARKHPGPETIRGLITEPITLQRGLVGAKPEAVCRWLFAVMGCEPEDELHDLFPGTGAVSQAWDRYRSEIRLVAA